MSHGIGRSFLNEPPQAPQLLDAAIIRAFLTAGQDIVQAVGVPNLGGTSVIR